MVLTEYICYLCFSTSPGFPFLSLSPLYLPADYKQRADSWIWGDTIWIWQKKISACRPHRRGYRVSCSEERGWFTVSSGKWSRYQTHPGVGDGQGSLVCCNPWGHKELDTTEQLNWTEPNAPLREHIASVSPSLYRCTAGCFLSLAYVGDAQGPTHLFKAKFSILLGMYSEGEYVNHL